MIPKRQRCMRRIVCFASSQSLSMAATEATLVTLRPLGVHTATSNAFDYLSAARSVVLAVVDVVESL